MKIDITISTKGTDTQLHISISKEPHDGKVTFTAGTKDSGKGESILPFEDEGGEFVPSEDEYLHPPDDDYEEEDDGYEEELQVHELDEHIEDIDIADELSQEADFVRSVREDEYSDDPPDEEEDWESSDYEHQRPF